MLKSSCRFRLTSAHSITPPPLTFGWSAIKRISSTSPQDRRLLFKFLGDSRSIKLPQSASLTAAYCGGPLCHSFLVTSPHFMGSDPQRGSLIYNEKAEVTERSVRDNSSKTAPFCGLMCQKTTVRVSVTVVFFLLYQQKIICFGCKAVL